jgi:hypothetical protein
MAKALSRHLELAKVAGTQADFPFDAVTGSGTSTRLFPLSL